MTNTKCYQLQVTLLEDLHTGTGAGAGDIDALQSRDRQGQPVIRATHLKGVLLDHANELVSLGLATSEQVSHLFGGRGGQQGALRMTSLRLAPGSTGQTLIWGGSARREGSRCPAPDTLRFVEYIAAGNVFHAELRIPDDEVLHQLISRLAQRLDTLGGGRNRGAGLIKTTLTPCAPVASKTPEISADACRLRLKLRNLEPLCLPATGEPGNLIRTQAYIRGQTLRGSLMAWAMGQSKQSVAEALVGARVGDAMPLPSELGASPLATLEVMPIPLSVQFPKPVGGNPGQPWWAGEEESPVQPVDLLHHAKPETKHKRPGANDYLARPGPDQAWQRYSPVVGVHLRNATPDRRSTSGDKAKPELFSLEEIAEDTVFVSDLDFDSSQAAQDFIKAFAPFLCLGEWLGLGRESRPVRIEDWCCLPAATPCQPSADDWTLTLTADAILRGPYLGFLENLDIRTLCAEAGTEANPDWQIDKAVVETAAVHGFNAASGLRRAPALALRRGSCWRISGTGCHELALALQKQGAIGERGTEGYGRFCINAQPIQGLAAHVGSRSELSPNVDEVRLALAENLAKSRSGPSPSQLQWLRSRALACSDENEFSQLLEEIDQAPERRPVGGKGWEKFGAKDLKEKCQGMSLAQKRLLVSDLVRALLRNAEEKKHD